MQDELGDPQLKFLPHLRAIRVDFAPVDATQHCESDWPHGQRIHLGHFVGWETCQNLGSGSHGQSTIQVLIWPSLRSLKVSYELLVVLGLEFV